MSLANKFGIPESLLDAAKKALDEANEYQKKVQAHMAKKGIKSMNDLTGDQKKKFFNELDAMHKAKNEEVEPVEEAESHQAKTTMKHIKNPTQGEKDASKNMKSGIPGYRDRIAMLHSAKARGALKKEEVELTQEDLDFIASLNQDEVTEGQLRNFSPHSDLAGRGRLSGYNKTAAGKKREYDRETERLKDKMKFTKGQGGIAGPKGPLPEEVELDEDEYKGKGLRYGHMGIKIRSEKHYKQLVQADKDRAEQRRKQEQETDGGNRKPDMTTQEYEKQHKELLARRKEHQRKVDMGHYGEEVDLDEEQLNEIKLKTAASAYKQMSAGGNDMKNRTGMAGDQSDRLLAKMKKKWGDKKVNKAIREEEDFTLEDFTVEEIEEFMQTEDYDQLDELSKETLGSYVKKRSHDVAAMGALTRKHAMDSEAKKKEQNYTGARDSDDKANKAFMKGWKHRQGIGRAVDKMVNKG